MFLMCLEKELHTFCTQKLCGLRTVALLASCVLTARHKCQSVLFPENVPHPSPVPHLLAPFPMTAQCGGCLLRSPSLPPQQPGLGLSSAASPAPTPDVCGRMWALFSSAPWVISLHN